ncbi:MAG: primary-amine oxidase [Pseudomonadota bacterium]|nr:tyramine oxidase [Gammaproteobacteria bacterium]MEC7918067.1 primary-amine oxidase [Pseudomonadota bacterium]|tara:strand:- start:86 stop:1981 length:1896 start_codon:yes stop_codon:yes gene_type:complete
MTHPLDQIISEEINKAVDLCKSHQDFCEETVFLSISLVEPDKELLRKGSDVELSRKLKIRGIDSNSDGGFESILDITNNQIISLDRVSNDAQVTYSMAEVFMAQELTKANKDYQEALEKRGITDLELIQIDPWPAGGIVHETIEPGHRAFKTISFLKENKSDNAYAKPINGIISHVDLTLKKVTCVEDHGVVELPKAHGRYDADSQSELRDEPKKIDITQPEGPGYIIEGNLISWEGWELRASVNPDEGPVLHQVSLNGRSILHRAALSDMVVPYGTADPMHSWKAVHDGTEYGFGSLVNSLTLGCDCLGEIHYLDANMLMFDGSVNTIENAICIHEEDYGIQWKHTDTNMMGANEVRRSRRLVISSIATIGNYDYGLFWYLYLDGTVQCEVKLTGIVGISSYDESIHRDDQDFRISDELVSPIHQHLFCIRLDWDLDNGDNQLFETNIETLPVSKENPNGMQLSAVSTHLKKESEAKRDISPASSRVWKIVNPNKKNSLGLPVAYKLLPGNTPTLLAHHDSPPGKRASFSKHNLWATPFKAEEMAAGGQNAVMHSGQGGLDDITSSDRDISECDLVTWHTFGLTHTPRPEDWPVMPVEYCGFHLIPVGFFDRNPTINLPPSCKGASKSNK